MEKPAGFCAKCTAESTDESSGSIQEGLFGHEFKGETQPCPDCLSHVSVLWKVVFGFPYKPVGCYRYKLVGVNFGGSKFLSRKVQDDPELIRKTRLMGILFAGVIFAAVLVVHYWKRR